MAEYIKREEVMDVREKLVEILRKPIFPHELVDPTEAVADYLLDNGVTVQEQENFREVTKKVEPLTLDELRQMYGEPVWAIGGDGTSEYVLIDKDGNGIDADTGYWDSDFYGLPGDGAHGLNVVGWLAYRRKPEEDDHAT